MSALARGLMAEVYRPAAATETLGPDDQLDGLDVVPGFVVRVGQIFD